MILEFCENKLNTVFEVTEDKRLLLLHFSDKTYKGNIDENAKKIYTPFEIHITGENPDAHHGFKHVASSGSESLKYVSHKYYKNELGNKLEFELCDGKLETVLHYQFYNGISAIRSWMEITNISDKAVGLEYVTSFCLTGINGEGTARDCMNLYVPRNSWCREVDWKEYSFVEAGFNNMMSCGETKRINISNTGTWSSKEYLPMGAVRNIKADSVIMWQIENNGSWNWEIGDIEGDNTYLKISGPAEQENHWYKELKPGECFESVKAGIAAGCSFDDALAQLTKYRRCITRENVTDKRLPVIFNDYMNCLNADPTTEKEIPVIDRAAMAGAEYYCMDAGWYADGTWWETVGEWQVCDRRFPGGIKAVFDYIRSKGMIPGIWLEIEVMGINCPIVNQFEDECFFMRHGKRVIDHGRYQLDFRNKKVREFAAGVVDRVVSEFGVGYIKMDYNIDAGIGNETDAQSFGDGLLGHNRAYLKWLSGIMDKYPDIVIENCASGGMRMDYAMLGLLPIQSVTDITEYDKMAHIASVAATAVLPEQAAIWSYPLEADDENATVMNMVNAMLLRIHLSGEIQKVSDRQMELIKEGVECYKNIRESIRESVPFYPLGTESYGKGWLAAGYRNNKNAYMAVWRMDDDNESIFIPDIKSKNIKIIYPVRNKCEIKNAVNGINVTLKDKKSAVVIQID